MAKEIKLKVAEAIQDDVNKGIVRIDTSMMQEIDARPGDIIEIEGERKTVGIADRAYPGDIGLNIIRMDGLIRKNASTGIGETTRVRKADVKEAKKVVIAPARKGMVIRASSNLFKQGLLGRAVVKGDIISLGGTRRRRSTMSESPFFGDIFSMLDESMVGFGLGDIKFIVVDTSPKQAVIISELTDIDFNPEAVEITEEKFPEVAYEDIGGLSEEIKKIREMVELPLKHPEIFERLGIEPPKGVLLHGPPGTGKTLLAKAVANETNANFILINGPEIMSKYYGQSEENLRKKFEEAEKGAPSIIFIDEIDAIASKREEVHGEVERRVVAQLLALMDGLKSRGKVVVIAATNIPNALDPALRRPGRFDREIDIGVPGKDGRLNILKIHTRNMPLSKNVNLKELANITHGFVGADLASLAKEAAMVVLRNVLPDLKMDQEEAVPKEMLERLRLTQKDFKDALKIVRPSALREVFVEIPNVKWENIGGLEDVKQELKEAVEWPLKNPDAFKRLGVRPPRGILLYGAPGTGKTMLAKAVANESEANFILVKGPELISKWVGESLPYDEELIIRRDGRIQRMKIGEIVENKRDVEVLTFDMDKRVVFSKIEDYIKHKSKTNLLEITTRTGRKIKVTADHSLFSFVNGKLCSLPSSHLVANESYVAVPKRLNLPRERIESINLFDYFRNEPSVFVVNVRGYLINSKKILGINRISQILSVSKKQLADIICKNLPVQITKFNEIIKEAKLAPNPKEISIKLKGSIHTYPSIFKIDKDFWKMIGLWVAEGDFNGYMVRIHNSNPEIRNDLRGICRKYKWNISEGERAVSINSLLMQKILRNVLGLSSGAGNKGIPELVFILDKESKANFLKGYFSGDGSIYMAEREKAKIEAGTISENLANDLLYLLLDFGIVASVYRKKERTGSTTCRISILGVRNFERFKDIGFIDNIRNGRIGGYIKSRKWVRSEIIPLSGELYEIASQNATVGDTIGKERLKEILVYVDMDKSIYKDYWNLVEGDIFFDLVKEIKPIKNEEFVYDIAVPEGQNFIGGFGGIFAHNSEKGIRKVFQKARQTSPTIIFFDEIDALAPRRGVGADSHATERVVNQMLTEMDGLEDLNDIVIIGATNRPDMLDTAMLRPGRFDRIILTPAPDEKTREEIFKVHAKGMPLKGVDLRELAKKTDGYVGADIEAICREAAIIALREDMKAKEVTKKHFDGALGKVRPSITKEVEEAYEDLQNFFKSARARQMKEEKPAYMG